MICKKFIYIFIVFIVSVLSVQAFEKAHVDYDESRIDYSLLNPKQVLKEADSYFQKYESTSDEKFLTTAMGKYYISTKLNPYDIYAKTQLARLYGEKHADRLAKEYFNLGLEINKKDPYVNYYFADFYFKRHDYKRALKYYKISYSNGYSNFYDLNVKIATIYEKFADLINAKVYYEKAYSLNPQSGYLKDKALQIQSLNYDQSEYYQRNNK